MGGEPLGAAYVAGWKKGKGNVPLSIVSKENCPAYNRKIKPGKVKEGDLVLKLARPIMTDPRGKFKPNWEGPYLVKKLFSKGAAILSDLEGNEFKEPINLDKLKKYFL